MTSIRITTATPDEVRQYLLSGLLTSSTPDPDNDLSIGYLELGGPATARLIYCGDSNLDGVVNADDYALVDRGFLHDAVGWQNGDFNYDNVINVADHLVIDRTFALQGTSLSPEMLADRTTRFGDQYVEQLLTSIPEPATALSVGLFVIVVPGRHRRRLRAAATPPSTGTPAVSR